MTSKSDISVVIDLGTSKMVAMAGRATNEGKMEILAISQVPSKGIKRGVVFNIAEASSALTAVLEELDTQLGDDFEIETVHVACAGKNMRTIDYKDSCPIGEDGIITNEHIENMFNKAKSLQLKNDYRILKVVPTTFIIDDEIEERKPVGATGHKIEAHYKLVIMPGTEYKNLKRTVESVGVELGEVYLSSLALAEATLSKPEKEMGAVVLDIGAGTTNLAVYYNNALVHTAVIPFAGMVITNDLKVGCATYFDKADLLKQRYGQALGDQVKTDDTVTIAKNTGWEAKEISIRSLAYIIQARLEEIVECVVHEIQKSGVEDVLGTGIVLTGGTTNLENIITLVKFHTGMDARKANTAINPVNRKEEIKDTAVLTALGALKLQLLAQTKQPSIMPEQKKSPRLGKSWFGNINKAWQGALTLFEEDKDDFELN